MSVLVLTNQSTCHSIKFQIRKRRLFTFIRNFGGDAKINLKIKGGKISAKVEYTGSSQSLLGILNPDGKWNGKLVKQRRKEKITLFVRRGKISRRGMRQVSELLQEDSDILFEGDKRRKSKRQDSQSQIKIALSPKLEVFGFITHKSGRHYTRIDLETNGTWNARGWIKLIGGKCIFSAEKGKCRFDFEGSPLLIPA